MIAAYSPQARGRSERMFGTLQKRLSQELRLAGIATMAEANRFLEELFWPAHNARFARPAADTGSAFVAFAGTLEDILCAQEDRVVAGDNTVRYKNRTLQIPADRHRLSLLLTPSGAETLVFWVSQPLAWLVAPKDVPLMTRRGVSSYRMARPRKPRERREARSCADHERYQITLKGMDFCAGRSL